MSQPKVAHITTIDSSLRYLLLNQLLTIQQAGYEVVGISSPGQDVSVIRAAGIRHIPVRMTRMGFTPLQDLLAIWYLFRVIRQERFDIVHTHNPKPGLIGQIAAKLAGVPVVLNTVHGFYFHDHMYPALRRFYIILERMAALCSDVILSQNHEDVDTAIRLKICPAHKIKYLGNGIDLSIFDPSRLNADRIRREREKLGISTDTMVIGFVGRLTAKRKGFLDFLRAGQKVVKRCGNVCLLIVGDADYGKPDAVKPSVARNYGIWDQCRFLGWRPNSQLPILYTLMDILILPSLFEGIPRTLIEASAMRVPCIVTDVKGNREVIKHGRNGLLVPWGDDQSLADATVRLLADRENIRRMGHEARRMALERFDERPVFERVKAEYGRLLQEKRFAVSASAANGLGKPSGANHAMFYRCHGKQMLDLALSIPVLIVLAPLLGLIAILVRLKLGSPVFFLQQRPGLQEKPFTLYKFRTMTHAVDENGDLLPDALRLTSFGRFFRSTSLDELPELFNVLRGDMSLVGPRPLLTQYLDRYTLEQMRRHEVKPGITGWAQVNGRNAITWEQKFEHDVWYVDHQSVWLDVKIIALTVLRILKREGINPEGHITMPEFRKSEEDHGWKKKHNFVRFLDLKWADINCDLHLHTSRTDGNTSIKAIIQYAIKIGLNRVAFTEHVRRDTEWFQEFIAEVRKERAFYRQIEVLIGCEAKAIDRQGSLDVKEEIITECDIVLGSVHRFPNGMGGYMDFSSLSQNQVAQIEYELTLGLLQSAPIDVLAHPGGMYFRRYSSDMPSEIIRDILKRSLQRRIAVEINTTYLGDFHGFLKLCAEVNPFVSIGSDMHFLHQLGECRDQLKDFGIGAK